MWLSTHKINVDTDTEGREELQQPSKPQRFPVRDEPAPKCKRARAPGSTYTSVEFRERKPAQSFTKPGQLGGVSGYAFFAEYRLSHEDGAP